MDNQWKEEECETCDFVTEWYNNGLYTKVPYGYCRKAPPVITEGAIGSIVERYPVVKKSNPACSCWREKHQVKKIS